MKVQIINKSKHELPKYATALSAGMDLRANINEPITLQPGERHLIPTGIHIGLPDGYEAQIRPRSGLSIKHGITLIKAEDYHFEYLSHSSGQKQNADNDPFLYAETHMPPYVALDCTADTEKPLKIYPTREMIKELLIERNRKIKEILGIDVPLDFSDI